MIDIQRSVSQHSPVVMPGLDPGIHLSASRRGQVSGENVDCRVKPGNDDEAVAELFHRHDVNSL